MAETKHGPDDDLTTDVSPVVESVFDTDVAPPRPDQSSAVGAEIDRPGLVATGLTKQFRRRRVVDGISVRIRPGEVVGLLGPNGAGKTTSFHLILGLIPPNDGRVLLDGHDITALPMYLRARRGIGYLPQEASIFRRMTVEENLLSILEMHGHPSDEARDRCNGLGPGEAGWPCVASRLHPSDRVGRRFREPGDSPGRELLSRARVTLRD